METVVDQKHAVHCAKVIPGLRAGLVLRTLSQDITRYPSIGMTIERIEELHPSSRKIM